MRKDDRISFLTNGSRGSSAVLSELYRCWADQQPAEQAFRHVRGKHAQEFVEDLGELHRRWRKELGLGG